MNRTSTRLILIMLLALLMGACASAKRSDGLRVTLYKYSSAVRWNEIEQAARFVDPAVVAVHPFTEADRARWAAVQVSRYLEAPQGIDADGTVTQSVQIELIDRATQTVRTIVDHQRWRYDEESETWWLASGLPKLD